MFSGESSGFYSSQVETLTYGSHEFTFATAEGSKFVYGLESGDPYRDLDDATRGVSMAQPLGLDSLYLNEMHGCSKEISCTDTNSFLSGGGYEYLRFEPGPLFLQPSSNSKSGTILAPAKETFQAHHVPPSPPSSQNFFFVPTTLFMKKDCSPQKVGNHLLDFFTSQVVASVTKVREEKYAIKAEVFVEGISCMMKVRVYDDGDQYAVEVQRRQGDAFILQSTYSLLLAYLESHYGGVVGQESDKPLAVPTVPEKDMIQEVADSSLEIVAPLLTMATIAGLQAEAASALSEMAKGGRTSAAPLLESADEVAAALTCLLASGRSDTVYPAARCMSNLAMFDEAGPLLAHQGLLRAAASQAVAELAEAQGLVGMALARAVADSLRCCTESLTSATAVEIQEVLDAALKNEMLANCDVVARSHLEQALFDTTLIVH